MDNRSEIFQQLKPLLQTYTPAMQPKVDDESHFDLWSVRNVVMNGRKYKEVYFAGLVIQKSYVGFYYMPIYANTELSRHFPPELLKLLKGKSCFHIKKLDEALLEQIRATLKTGFEMYQERGWV